MKLLREDYDSSPRSITRWYRYYSVTQAEFDNLKDLHTLHLDARPYNLAPIYHNYDGFTELSKSGIKGDASLWRYYAECCENYILNGILY